jgi:hypothetical protein
MHPETQHGIADFCDFSQITCFFWLFYGLLGGFTGLLLTIWRPHKVLFCRHFREKAIAGGKKTLGQVSCRVSIVEGAK